jgi:exopolysaccharide production protein ExoZ
MAADIQSQMTYRSDIPVTMPPSGPASEKSLSRTRVNFGDVAAIQYLRGVAAVMVAFAHANEQFMTDLHRAWRDIGWSGVDLFFVISGFVMTYTTATHSYTRSGFFLRRLARIAPMYWLMTLVTALLAISAPRLFQTTHFGWTNLIESLLFIPSRDPVTGHIEPLLHLGWTLNYEMFFYCWFAILLALSAFKRTVVLAIVFSAFGVCAAIFHPTSVLLGVYGSPVTFEFLFGCFVGALYIQGRLSNAPISLCCAMALMGVCLLIYGALLNDSTNHREIFRGVPAAIVILSMLAIDLKFPFRSYWLHKLGDATYSIYLTHIFVVMGVRKVWLAVHLSTSGPAAYLFVAVCVVGAAVVGMAAYEFVEKPLTGRAKTMLTKTGRVTVGKRVDPIKP